MQQSLSEPDGVPFTDLAAVSDPMQVPVTPFRTYRDGPETDNHRGTSIRLVMRDPAL